MIFGVDKLIIFAIQTSEKLDHLEYPAVISQPWHS